MEKTLQKIFGESPTVKVITFLINGRDFDYSISDIAEGSEISRVTTYDVIGNLLKKKLIKKTRKLGVSPLYKINMESKEIKILLKTYSELLKVQNR